MLLTLEELKDFLNEKVQKYNTKTYFLEDDPISIPHRFSQKKDIEITAFIIATLAWGNRKAIIKSGEKLLKIMGNSPYDFVMNYKENYKNEFQFVHRTFNIDDLDFFIRSLQHLYQDHETSLENAFSLHHEIEGTKGRIIHFREKFLETEHLQRSEKHLSNPGKGSSAKRLNMFLRWMVRQDPSGVDFGIWGSIHPSELYLPLDVHTGSISRKLGILTRRQNDWQAVEEIQKVLLKLDPKDPIKYDFALFGLGAYENF